MFNFYQEWFLTKSVKFKLVNTHKVEYYSMSNSTSVFMYVRDLNFKNHKSSENGTKLL